MGEVAYFFLAVFIASGLCAVLAVIAAMLWLYPCAAAVPKAVPSYCGFFPEIFVPVWIGIFAWAYRSLLRAVEG